MTNPFHYGPSGHNPDVTLTGFLPRIRSSYASVVSGSNPNLASSTQSPLNRLSYLLNPANDSASDLYSLHPSRTHDMDADNHPIQHSTEVGAAYLGSRAPQLPPFSRAFEMFMDYETSHGGWPNMRGNGGFFTPSYLRGSTYIQKLEEAYRAKESQRDSQQPHGVGLQNMGAHTPLGTKTPASHLGMTYDLIERAPTFEDNESIPPLPTRWNRDDKYGALEVSADGLEVKYQPTVRNAREQEHEVCGIRADHPMPSQAGVYYFEVTLMSRRRDETTVCIGFLTKNVSLSRPPGWEPDSYGYHGDDGDVYSGGNVGKRYKDTFGPGDTIGCGINFRTGSVFFTKNANGLGIAFQNVKGKLYPAVGVKKPGEHVRVNFGQKPFIFNIENYMNNEQEIIRSAIARTSIEKLVSPPINETELIQQLVLQFLQHDGYVETARAFAEEIQNEKQALRIDSGVPVAGINIKDDEDAHRRQRIRRAILEGDIDKALKYTNTYYPRVLEDNSHVYFKLKCRKFIEMVRKSAEQSAGPGKKSNGHSYDDIPNEMDVDENGFSDKMEEDGLDLQTDEGSLLAETETIEYGQALQAEFKDDPRREVEKALGDVFALLAYENPLQVKEVAPLLDRKGRVSVAEELNSAILSSLGKSSRSALENLYGQTSVLLDYLREDGGPGSFVTIRSVIDKIPKSQPF
ncbi:SPRY domain-containing protein [Biscogniauxia sp. FL1348]|nr:SPRY domain-containing protein [Biscogniauxia sp. FL1348]